MWKLLVFAIFFSFGDTKSYYAKVNGDVNSFCNITNPCSLNSCFERAKDGDVIYTYYGEYSNFSILLNHSVMFVGLANTTHYPKLVVPFSIKTTKSVNFIMTGFRIIPNDTIENFIESSEIDVNVTLSNIIVEESESTKFSFLRMLNGYKVNLINSKFHNGINQFSSLLYFSNTKFINIENITMDYSSSSIPSKYQKEQTYPRIYLQNKFTQLTLKSSKFSKTKGGVFYLDSVSLFSTPSEYFNLVFESNSFNYCENNFKAGKDNGGAIYFSGISSSKVNFIIKNSLFHGNIGKTFGGAIYLYYINSTEIVNSNFSKNRAEHSSFQYGGGIVARSSSYFSLRSSQISNNFGRSGSGGLFLLNIGIVEIQNSRISNNDGIGVYLSSIGKKCVINNCLFEKNYASNEGGGVYGNTVKILEVLNSRFVSNQAKSLGGAISVLTLYRILIFNSSFIKNTGTTGGGFYVENSKKNYVFNSSFEFNNASEGDGGGFIITNGENFEFHNNFIRGSYAKMYGGGFFIKNIPNANIVSSIFSYSSSMYGAGFASILKEKVYLSNLANQTLKISNCKFNNLYSVSSGAGVFIQSNVDLYMEYCSFTDLHSGIYGGAFSSTCRDYYIRNCTFHNCSSSQGGGACFLGNQAGKNVENVQFSRILRMEYCNFSENSITNDDSKKAGSSLFIQSIPFSEIKGIRILGSTERKYCCMEVNFISCGMINLTNWEIEGSGGGINSLYNEEINIVDSKFSNLDSKNAKLQSPFLFTDNFLYKDNRDGKASFDGGVFIFECEFENCKGVYGGVASFGGQNVLTVEFSKFVSNRAEKSGGVFFSEGRLFKNKEVQIEKKIFYDTLPGNILRSCIFQNNVAVKSGGVMYIKGLRNLVLVEGCTFENNTAFEGSDIFGDSSYYIKVLNSTLRGSINLLQISNQDTKTGGEVTKARNEIEYGSIKTVLSCLLFWNSTMENVRGGGLSVSGGYLDIRNSILRNTMRGRAISIFDSNFDQISPEVSMLENRELQIRDVLITNSEGSASWSPDGGALLIKSSQQSYKIKNLNISFSSSGSGGYGGALYFEGNTKGVYIQGVNIMNCSAYYGGALSYKSTDISFLSGYLTSSKKKNEGFFDVTGTKAVWLGKHIFKFYDMNETTHTHSDELMKSIGNTSEVGTNPQYFLFKNFEKEGKIVSCESISCKNKNITESTLFSVFPGEPFQIRVYVLDTFKRIIPIYSTFFAEITVIPKFSSSKNIRMKTYNPTVYLSDLRNNHLIFSDLMLLQKDIIKSYEKQKRLEEVFVIISSPFIKYNLTFTFRINKCPKGYRIYLQKIDDSGGSSDNSSLGLEECISCREGEYSLLENNVKCSPCPSGTIVQTCTTFEVVTKDNYWSEINPKNGEIEIHECRNGKCKKGNQCDDNFSNKFPICGGCIDGHSEWGNKCVKCENDFNVDLIFLWLFIMLLLAALFHINSQDVDSAIEKIISFFGQFAALIVFPLQVDLNAFLQIINVVVMFRIPSFTSIAGSSGSDKCPFKRNSYVKILLQSLLNPFTYFVVFLSYCIILLCAKILVINRLKTFWCYICLKKFGKEKESGSNDDELEDSNVIGDTDTNDEKAVAVGENLKDREDAFEEGGKKMDDSEYTSSPSSSDISTSSDLEDVINEENVILEDEKRDREINIDLKMLEMRNVEFDGTLKAVKNINTSADEEESDEMSDSGEEKTEEKKISREKALKIIKRGITEIYFLLYRTFRNILKLFFRIEYFKVSFFNLIIVTYSLFLESSFRYFSCKKFGNYGSKENSEYYLIANTDIKCFTRMYNSFLPFFILLVIYVALFPIGILIFLIWNRKLVRVANNYDPDEISKDVKKKKKKGVKSNKLITRIRKLLSFFNRVCFNPTSTKEKKEEMTLEKKALKEKLFIKRYGTIFFPYNDKVNGWYEVFLLYRRCLLVLFLTIIRDLNSFTSNFLVIFTLLVSLILHVHFKPFKRLEENIIEFLSLCSLLLLQVVKGSFKVNNLDQKGFEYVFGYVLLFALFIPTLMLTLVYKFKINNFINLGLKLFRRIFWIFFCLRYVHIDEYYQKWKKRKDEEKPSDSSSDDSSDNDGDVKSQDCEAKHEEDVKKMLDLIVN